MTETSAVLGQAVAALDIAVTEPARAVRLATNAAHLANGDPEAAAVARRALGMACTALGRLVPAERHLRTAIGVADGAGLAVRAAEARGSLAYVLTLSGRTDDALAEIALAAPVLRDVPAARLAMLRALILTELARFDEAAAGFADALAILHRAGGDAVLEADIRTNRSLLLVHRRDWRAAEDDLRRAEANYLATGHTGRTAMVHHNRGLAAAVRGDLPAALAAFDEAATRYRAAGRDLGLLPVEQAEALLSVRLVAEARAAAETAIAEYTRQRNAVDLVQARLLLAQSALLAGDPATARTEAERARRSAARQHRAGWVALAAYVALRARWAAGDRDPALLRSGRRTVAALTGAGWLVAATDARLIVARTAIALGRTAVATGQLAATAPARSTGPAELRARAWHALALLRIAQGDVRGARAALRAGMRVVDAFRASLGATELRAHASGHAGELAELGLRLALDSGRAGQVLLWAERWRAGALLLRPARPPDDAELAGDLAELRQVAVELAEVAARSGDTSALLHRQSSVERRVRARARHASGTHAPVPPVSATALRAALGERALVEFVEHDGVFSAVTVAGGRTRLHALGPVAEVAEQLDALRFGLRSVGYQLGSARATAASVELIERRAERLDRLLLRPLAADLGDRELVVVPTGALHAMPWPALPGCAARPVSVAPSAALWHRALRGPADPSGHRVFAAGPGLPHATAEVTALSRHRPGLRFTGRRARVEDVTAALDGAGLGHIAAHGTFRADNPLFSALHLADGPLTVYDLERLGTPPRDLVLSACDSGLPAVHPGDELLGLAAALLGLGTRSLVATVVPVQDRTSRPLMLRLHRHLDAGLGPAAALCRAQRDVARGDDVTARVTALGFVCFGAG